MPYFPVIASPKPRSRNRLIEALYERGWAANWGTIRQALLSEREGHRVIWVSGANLIWFDRDLQMPFDAWIARRYLVLLNSPAHMLAYLDHHKLNPRDHEARIVRGGLAEVAAQALDHDDLVRLAGD